jgi:hypothetical protein
MAQIGNLHCGGQLQLVGNLPGGVPGPPAVCFGGGGGTPPINGTLYVDGAALIGNGAVYPTIEADVMIAPSINPRVLASPSLVKITSRGGINTPIDVIVGDQTGPVGVNIFCGPQPFVVQSTSINLTTIRYTTTAPKQTNVGSKDNVGSEVTTGATQRAGVSKKLDVALNSAPIKADAPIVAPDIKSDAATLNQTYFIAQSKKSFDIKHPTKEGYRLRYICLEGPEAEVYYRGKLKDSNVIELPDYWTGLVDTETISVSLTPFGIYQELFVEKIEWGRRIIVKNNLGGPIDCSYIVYGERKDVVKNIPEYEGNTPDDYPGDNSEYFINGGK